MTLHPWPLNDNSSTGDHAEVLWTGRDGLGLFADSLAVPLRFLPDAPSLAAAVAVFVEPKSADVFKPLALFCLRDIGSRFGAGS